MFQFSRWWMLVSLHWAENRRRYGLGVLAMGGLLLFWFSVVVAMDAYAPGLPTSALPPSREELVEDNLAENCLARLAAAITVPDPGPPVASPGAPQAMGPEVVGYVAPPPEPPPTFY